jgi:hypothetical protein
VTVRGRKGNMGWLTRGGLVSVPCGGEGSSSRWAGELGRCASWPAQAKVGWRGELGWPVGRVIYSVGLGWFGILARWVWVGNGLGLGLGLWIGSGLLADLI